LTKPGSAGSGPESSAFFAPQITAPKGGGAIRSIGEKFTANPVTGTGSLSIPISTSPGRSGFGPQLALSYDTGTGNGSFGVGWSLGAPAIARRTDKGLPRFDDAAESDIFILSGSEDLVRVLDAETGAHQQTPDRDGYAIRTYRPRTEGLFARIERWTCPDDGVAHWRSLSRDNVLTFYGFDAASRIADPADPARVFSWLICRSYDDKGNAIVYDYEAENDSGVDLDLPSEQRRSRTANRYLKRIRYGNSHAAPDRSRSTRLPPFASFRARSRRDRLDVQRYLRLRRGALPRRSARRGRPVICLRGHRAAAALVIASGSVLQFSLHLRGQNLPPVPPRPDVSPLPGASRRRPLFGQEHDLPLPRETVRIVYRARRSGGAYTPA
jgi:hypothetical protein